MHRLVRAYPWSRCGCARANFILLLMTERATYRDFAEGNYPGVNEQEVATLLPTSRLKPHDRQSGNHLEMAEIARGYAVAEFQGRHPDQQIG